MSHQADEAPAFAFAFQARRFACDRCHRYKLKCERGPLLLNSGVATPLGPCKRCEKAGVECTSSSAATSTSRRKEINTTQISSESTKTSHTRSSPNTTSLATESSNDLGSLSPFARPLFNGMESTPIDPALYLDNFDFDMAAIGGESVHHFNVSPATNHRLPSPNKSQSSSSNRQLGADEQPQINRGEDIGEDGPAMSDFLNTPPTESLLWTNENSLSAAAGPTRRSASFNPVDTLNKLSELQAFIFKEFGCITEETLTKTFLSQNTGSCHALGSASPDSGLVGKVLYASHRLMDILTSCGRNEAGLPSASPPRLRSDSLSGSKRTHSNVLEDEELLQTEIATSGSLRFSSPVANPLTTHLDFLRKTTTNPINGRPPPSPKRTSSTGSETLIPSGLLSPAKLTLLVCYVTLLSVYRSIFTQAFEILRTPPPPSPQSRTPRFGPFRTSTATPQPHSPHISTTIIMGFRIQLEMLTHT